MTIVQSRSGRFKKGEMEKRKKKDREREKERGKFNTNQHSLYHSCVIEFHRRVE
jgi:hypothetical protein